VEFQNINTFGILSSAPNGRIVSKIYSLVTEVLEDLEVKKDDNENHLTNELCKSLGFLLPSDSPFYFHHQNIESSSENTSTDFAAFGTFAYAHLTQQKGKNFPLVKFEAKRLNSTMPKKREKEYVLGEYVAGKLTKNSGGIERFKNLRHGKNDYNACIIGYVQTDSFEYWVNKINSWIAEEISNPHDSTLIWDDSDILQSDQIGRVNGYLSTPKRRNRPPLTMRHLWKLFKS
tara:strand:- start:3055 stop:3750 length:696 start_codon:yes stop_codon:yes gene_type:complete